jgi:hypothetical protein
MPYSYHPPLIPPFRHRSRTELTSPPFYVVRTGSSHTVFIMLQTDGSNECKPVTPTADDTQHVSGIRKRFANLFVSSKRSDTDLSNADKIVDSDENADDDSPMRVLSPRATESASSTMPRVKKRTFLVKRRLSKRVPSVKMPDAPPSAQEPEKDDLMSLKMPAAPPSAHKPEKDDVMSGAGHIPVTDAPSPLKKSLDKNTGALPTRQTALTSHPVFRLEVESEETFVTPDSGSGVIESV